MCVNAQWTRIPPPELYMEVYPQNTASSFLAMHVHILYRVLSHGTQPLNILPIKPWWVCYDSVAIQD